jgi:hypothetical protein
MQCRSCGTEIADKAIVCYRCGAGTTDPVRKPAAIRPAARASLAPAIVLLLLALAALLGAQPSGDPREMEIGAMVLACLGAVLLIARLLRRR